MALAVISPKWILSQWSSLWNGEHIRKWVLQLSPPINHSSVKAPQAGFKENGFFFLPSGTFWILGALWSSIANECWPDGGWRRPGSALTRAYLRGNASWGWSVTWARRWPLSGRHITSFHCLTAAVRQILSAHLPHVGQHALCVVQLGESPSPDVPSHPVVFYCLSSGFTHADVIVDNPINHN